MKILVAVDGSSYTKRMLGYLAAHDEWLGGAHQYTVLHSVPAVPPRAAAVIDKMTLKAYYDNISLAYYLTGDLNQALVYTEKSQYAELYTWIYDEQSKIFKATGNYPKAISSMENLLGIKDFNEELMHFEM